MITSVLLLVLGFGAPFIYFYLSKNPHFGGKPTQKELADLKASPHWKKGKFYNLSKTTMDVNLSTIPKLLAESIKGRKIRNPKVAIPLSSFDPLAFKRNAHPKFVWYGHSTLLLQLDQKNILIDPMFGEDASPVGPMRTKRFSKSTLECIAELPEIHAVLLTHDHYDHLDFHSIRLLKGKVPLFLVPLGVSKHLRHWGLDQASIKEFDWWQKEQLLDLTFVFTPSRHFSGRGLSDRATSLWGGWVIQAASNRVYWSGDGGYGDHFEQIGQKYGPFDWGFMECGQYNKRWHQIHMYPEEAVQAAIEAKVQCAIPVHWGAFSLAMHHWKEPIERFTTEADIKQLPYASPALGQVVELNAHKNISWWENYQ